MKALRLAWAGVDRVAGGRKGSCLWAPGVHKHFGKEGDSPHAGCGRRRRENW